MPVILLDNSKKDAFYTAITDKTINSLRVGSVLRIKIIKLNQPTSLSAAINSLKH